MLLLYDLTLHQGCEIILLIPWWRRDEVHKSNFAYHGYVMRTTSAKFTSLNDINISCEWKGFNLFVPGEESGVLFGFERSKVNDYMNSANKLLATEMLMRFLYQLLPVILFIDHHQPFGERHNGRVEQVDGPYQLLSTPSIPYHWLLHKYIG